METKLAEVRDFEQFSQAIDTASNIITKDYLCKLEKYEVYEIPEELKNLQISDYMRLFKLKKLVSDKKESMLDKLVTVLNAAYTSDASVITLIRGQEQFTEYYLGIVSKDIGSEGNDIGTQGESFKGVLTGNFPGVEIENIDKMNIEALCERVFEDDYITAISGIASIRNEKEHNMEKYVQGIEHLVDSLQGREYSVIVIADSINANEIVMAKSGYENLYTQLTPFLKTSLSFNETDTITVTQSHTEGITKSIGESTSLTQNYSKTSGWSDSSGVNETTTKDKGRMIGSLAGAGLGIAATAITGGAAAPVIAAAAYMGSQVAGSVGSGLIGSSSKGTNQSSTISGSINEAVGNTSSKNSSTANQSSDTDSQSEGTSQGRTLQFTNENKTVKNLLTRIDKHIERLEKCEAYGAFNCATYVISSDPETNAIVSNGYNALMRGDNSALQASYINSWYGEDKVKAYLEKFSHPLFVNDKQSDVIVSPASMANSYEMAVNLGMPKKSINGLPVFEMASFGRNVFANGNRESSNNINLGAIYHMGVSEKIKVNLDVKSLAMHTFVTGSTGSGKSNTVYQLLRELRKKDVNFLVVEPAKGEYKHVFGNDENVHVYGTNPYYTPMLRINPFRFPKGIHVLEHIDRLIEIFNVCWPMYAAMPAVLKDSVEKAYVSAGWDLGLSENKYNENLFPTFADVLRELNLVVEKSAFSQEVKDNYIGSLATRIKSLTNGIYGRIFDTNELGDEKLFDEDVIVDLSRVGAVETKSMIMGILVMRLQEYRMTSGGMNVDLKHVTVLEEAHNLLKRTSTEQSSESSNLLGKSVEMLANAIAEVRTYGEGFIIADQAPGLMDLSVIRNTNTKIIMRLPDAEDRKLVGKAANLTDEQINELAKLPTGVAAVYQNNWIESVLCKVNYENVEGVYQEEKDGVMFCDSKKILVKALLDKLAGEKLEYNLKTLRNYILETNIPTGVKVKILGVLRQNGKVEMDDIKAVMYDIVCTPKMAEEAEQMESIENWKDTFVYAENSVLAELTEMEQNLAVECILREQIARFDKPDEYLETWYKYLKGEVL